MSMKYTSPDGAYQIGKKMVHMTSCFSTPPVLLVTLTYARWTVHFNPAPGRFLMLISTRPVFISHDTHVHRLNQLFAAQRAKHSTPMHHTRPIINNNLYTCQISCCTLTAYFLQVLQEIAPSFVSLFSVLPAHSRTWYQFCHSFQATALKQSESEEGRRFCL